MTERKKTREQAGTPAEPTTPEAEPDYEHARSELVDVVGRLEAGGVGLEESMALWERGEHLASLCQRYLDHARARLDRVTGAEAE